MSPVNCHDARVLLMAYIDSELDAATTVSVREHLTSCATCASRFEREEQLEGALAALLREGAMPADVVRRLDEALLSASSEGDAGDAREPLPGRESGRESGSRSRRPDTWRWIAAAALLLVAVTLWITDDGVSREQAPIYVGNFVSAWESAVERRATSATPLPVRDAGAIRAMLDEASLTAFEFPGDGRVHDHAVHLLGARVEDFDGVRAVNVLYDCCGELTSVFVLPKRALEAWPGGSPVGSGTLRGPADLEVEGVRTRTVIRDGLLIGVVSRHASGLADQWSG